MTKEQNADPVESPNASQGEEDLFPVADVRKETSIWQRLFGSTRMWIATVVCAIIALVLVIVSLANWGTVIAISFEDGHGIKPGDTLRYRGIDVGEVVKVDVDSGLGGVTVHVALQQNATDLAREGSQFWIERPQFGLSRISGLETVVGAKFIGVIPGDEASSSQYRFKGIESPPVIRDGSGRRITIVFEDGHGIATGDVVRHLGIVIGEVTAVDLAEDLNSVTVHVRLSESAARVARAGSQFWIERPELGLTEIRGLETLIRGPYIDFLPGAESAPLVRHFQGVENAPPSIREPDGLEVILTSNQKRALRPGVPVTYRGLNVGHVVSVGLASDASSIQARVYIAPDYKSLVRINSQFWSNVGIDADVGVRGIQLKTDSLQSLAIGSIGFATPEDRARKARTGDRFQCADALDPEWLDWNPRIAVGELMLPEGASRPEPIRSKIRWEQRQIAITREFHRQGWLLLLDDGTLTGLSRYLQPDENARDDSVFFEMSGKEIPYDPSQFSGNGLTGAYAMNDQDIDQPGWPASRIRKPDSAEDCLIVSDPQATAAPLAASQIDQIQDDRWLIAPSLSFNASLDGACVVSRNDGRLIGFLDLERGQAEVIFIADQ